LNIITSFVLFDPIPPSIAARTASGILPETSRALPASSRQAFLQTGSSSVRGASHFRGARVPTLAAGDERAIRGLPPARRLMRVRRTKPEPFHSIAPLLPTRGPATR